MNVEEAAATCNALWSPSHSTSSPSLAVSKHPSRLDSPSPGVSSQFKVRESAESTGVTDISQITRLHCPACEKVTPSELSVRSERPSFWKSLDYLFASLQCCGEAQATSSQTIVYACVKCGTVVARLHQR